MIQQKHNKNVFKLIWYLNFQQSHHQRMWKGTCSSWTLGCTWRKQLQQLSTQCCTCFIAKKTVQKNVLSSAASTNLGLFQHPILYHAGWSFWRCPMMPRRIKSLPCWKSLVLHRVMRQKDAGCRFQSHAPSMCFRTGFLGFVIVAVKPL